MNKLNVKMEVKKPSLSPDIIEYLEKNPALKKVLEKNANSDNHRRREYEDHVKFILKLIHNHTHKVSDITDLPQYIHSLNVLSVPHFEDMMKQRGSEMIQHVHELSRQHNETLNQHKSQTKTRFGKVSNEIEQLNSKFEDLNLKPEHVESIKTIIGNLSKSKPSEMKDEFNPDEFRTGLIAEITSQLKGTSKVIYVNQGGGGLASLPLNRIPGVNIGEVGNPLMNGQALVFQQSTGLWINANVGGGGGGAFTPVPETTDFTVDHSNNFSRYLVTGEVTATFNTNIQAADEFIFMVRTDAKLTLQLGTDQILAVSPSIVSSTAGTIFAESKYCLIHVYANSSTEFQAQSVIGSWQKT